MKLEGSDPDEDLAEIYVTFSGGTGEWLFFDNEATTLYTDPTSEYWTEGTYQVTIVLEDFEGNQARNPLVIEVSCPTGSDHPICYVEPEVDTTIATVIDDTVTTTTAPSLSESLTTGTTQEFFDYEEDPAQSLSDTVEPLDLSLEDDPDFVDEPGIVTEEQAAELIEEIENAASEEI